MNQAGMKQTMFDPCLFVGEYVMCVCNVDDLILWSRDEQDIDMLAN